MTPATLAPPPPAEIPAAEPTLSGPPPHVPVRPPFQRTPHRDRTGRVTRRALAVSLGVHLLLGVAFFLAARGEGGSDAQADDAQAPREAVDYVELPFPDAGEAPAPLPDFPSTAAAGAPELTASGADSAARVPELQRFPTAAPRGLPPVPPRAGGPAVPGAPRTGAPATGTGPRSGPAAGRLGPEYGDSRLIVRPQAVPERELTDLERYNAHLQARIQGINDSIADEADRQRRARNWIYRDKNGREWGIADGGVPVVGGQRIPTRVAPPITRDRDGDDAGREAVRQRREIDAQAETQDRDRVIRERNRAIRERQDAERRRRREEEERRRREGSRTP